MIVNTEQRAVRAGMQARKDGSFETEAPLMQDCYLESFRKGWQLQNQIMMLGRPEDRFLVDHYVHEIDLGEPKNKQCRPLQRSRSFQLDKRAQVILKTIRDHTKLSDSSIINLLLDMVAPVAINIKKQNEGVFK